jgi:predicted dehydrogenase
MQTSLRVGLIGYGYASKTFHAPLIAGVPGLQLAAVSSRDPAKVHADWPALPVHADPLELIARPDIDLVVVPTPNDTHEALARAALRAGKHVVVDKPFTVTLAQAQALTQLAGAQRRVLSVFHNRRWDGDFLTLQQLLRSGTLGRIVHLASHFDRYRPDVRARWRETPGPGSGLWFDLGPHLLDQALQLFGWPQGIQLDRATLRDGALTDDWFHAQLRYEGLRVTLHASTLAAAAGPRFAVHGTRGSWVKQGLDTQEGALKAGARPAWPPHPGWGADPGPAVLTVPQGEALVSTTTTLAPGRYGDYYAALREAIVSGAPNPVPAEQALQVMALIERGIASADQRCEVQAGPPAPGRRE